MFYYSTPAPDAVIRLTASVEETLRRNALRPVPKPEAVIVASHARAAMTRFLAVPTMTISAHLPIDQVIEECQAFVIKTLDISHTSPAQGCVALRNVLR